MRDPAPIPQSPAVALSAVSKNYGEVAALELLSLDVPCGELVCLLGPSGCGKTTTLRLIAGFTSPTRGRVFIEGADVTAKPPHLRNIGMVFQHPALFPHLSVFDNVEFGMRNIGVAKPERRKRVDAMLATVRLADLGARYPRELSGGQQQRVALARALVLRPAVLLLDEPFSSLDAQLRIHMREEVRALVHQLNATTVLVTHDQEEALAIADRVVVMNKGRIEQIGAPSDIYDVPQSRFVAGFIGRCNLLPCKSAGAARTVTIEGGHLLSIANDPAGDKGVVAIRPEHLVLANGQSPNNLRVEVLQFTYLGSRTHLHVALQNLKMLIDLPSAEAKGLSIGQPLELSVDPAFVRFLP
ncbi:MAG TPA: ABC transporter ATP-binding protein [Xanthobacteraceae bacterium]|jgi:putative spermidine/putrescine transport system ATP-binding protein